MTKLVYRPLAMAISVLGGLVASAIFQTKPKRLF